MEGKCFKVLAENIPYFQKHFVELISASKTKQTSKNNSNPQLPTQNNRYEFTFVGAPLRDPVAALDVASAAPNYSGLGKHQRSPSAALIDREAKIPHLIPCGVDSSGYLLTLFKELSRFLSSSGYLLKKLQRPKFSRNVEERGAPEAGHSLYQCVAVKEDLTPALEAMERILMRLQAASDAFLQELDDFDNLTGINEELNGILGIAKKKVAEIKSSAAAPRDGRPMDSDARKRLENLRNSEAKNNLRLGGVSYRLVKKIGKGSFAVVYEAERVTDDSKVAIKFYLGGTKDQATQEFRCYSMLRDCDFFSNVYSLDIDSTLHCIIVMELLGSTLQDILDERSTMPTKQVLQLAVALVSALEKLHQKNIVHGDIKPANIILGLSNDPKLIDFGLSHTYKHGAIHIHCHQLQGSLRYMSINSHLRKALSPRDDLESLLYVVIFALKGSLPWQKVVASEDSLSSRNDKVFKSKQKTSPEELCTTLPEGIEPALDYVRNLQAGEIPSYQRLRDFLSESRWES